MMDPQHWQRIQSICEAAVALASGERESYLHQACAGDEELRKDIESFLSCAAHEKGFLDSPVLQHEARELVKDRMPGAEADLTGQILLHYIIMGKIGTGGMGEVYRARDDRLKRDVAIKVLPDIFSGDPERLARFDREARLLASLNHTNIGTIHGLEESGGKRFLVLELVEGPTLAERLRHGSLPVAEALQVCRQIAEAVEAAHEKGIIHRDLKPANVKLTREGKVKVLDFGLAKAFHEEQAPADAAQSPAITNHMTRPGVILGTAAYMSPEQAGGKPVDKRADIWAFGCILYECLSGRRAFQGDSIREVVVSTLTSDPDWGALPEALPASIRTLLRRCLRKDPESRLRDIGDARIEIGDSESKPSDPAPSPRRLSLRGSAAAVLAALLAGIIIGPSIMILIRPSPAPSAVTSSIKITPGRWLAGMLGILELQRPSRTAMAISSDGRFLVYSAIEANPAAQARPQLYLRRMDQEDARPIAGTEGGYSPFLSPDNRWVGFWAGGKLKKIPVDGGVATDLCEAFRVFGVHWGGSHNIVFADNEDTGISMVSDAGGKPQRLSTHDPERDEYGHRMPFWLPAGKAVVFTVMRHSWDPHPRLALLRLDTGEKRLILEDAADGRYLPTVHLVFLREGTLMAVRFNLAGMKVMGQPVSIVENVMQSFSTNSELNTGAGQFAVSDTGRLVYAAGGMVPPPMNSLVWVDRKGNEEPVTDLKAPYSAPRLSPDGRRIAYDAAEIEHPVYVYDLFTDTHSRLRQEGQVIFPIWTPDGKRLVFSLMRSVALNPFWQPYDGSAAPELLAKNQSDLMAASWSPDGKLALVEWKPEKAQQDIVVLDARSGQVTPFLNSSFDEIYPEFSPDGRWLAYTSKEAGRNEVYVQDFPGKRIKRQISSGGGAAPLWARDGKQLYFMHQKNLWAVDVLADAGFAVGKPRLFVTLKSVYLSTTPVRCYDLSQDGQRFLMVKLDQRSPSPATELTLIQNWFKELERLCPAGR